MKWQRMFALAVFASALAGLSVPALAQGVKQTKGVLEKVDPSGQHIVIRETHGRKGLLPLAVAQDAKIETSEGTGGSLAGLHVGDEVTIHYGTGPHGEEAREIQVTKAAPAK